MLDAYIVGEEVDELFDEEGLIDSPRRGWFCGFDIDELASGSRIILSKDGGDAPLSYFEDAFLSRSQAERSKKMLDDQIIDFPEEGVEFEFARKLSNLFSVAVESGKGVLFVCD